MTLSYSTKAYMPIVGDKIVKSRMRCAGNMVRMKDERLPKRSVTKKVAEKRGRSQLRWEDYVKRDLRKAEEEEKWREMANKRDQWKHLQKLPTESDTLQKRNQRNCKILTFAQALPILSPLFF